jgi:hypothetical protein
MWKPVAKSTTGVRTTLSIPEPLFDTFSERAIKKGRTAEEEIVQHLDATQSHTGTTPLFLGDDERNELSQIAGRTLRTPRELIEWAKRLSSINVGGTSIALDERLLTRLDTRRFGKTMPDMITKTVTEALEERVGLR